VFKAKRNGTGYDKEQEVVGEAVIVLCILNQELTHNRAVLKPFLPPCQPAISRFVGSFAKTPDFFC
jgi:hypothetical protein